MTTRQRPSDHPIPALPNVRAVVSYLREHGYKVSQSKIYADKGRGRLLVQPDGSVYKPDADIYATNHLKKADAELENIRCDILVLERNIKAMELEKLKIDVAIAKICLRNVSGLADEKSPSARAL